MEDDAKREEYVLNDKGKVYIGGYRQPRGRPWAFGQFDDVVLPVACYILEASKHLTGYRGDPVKIVRAISAGVSINFHLFVLTKINQSSTYRLTTYYSIYSTFRGIHFG